MNRGEVAHQMQKSHYADMLGRIFPACLSPFICAMPKAATPLKTGEVVFCHFHGNPKNLGYACGRMGGIVICCFPMFPLGRHGGAARETYIPCVPRPPVGFGLFPPDLFEQFDQTAGAFRVYHPHI